jgi:hypothetical protein
MQCTDLQVFLRISNHPRPRCRFRSLAGRGQRSSSTEIGDRMDLIFSALRRKGEAITSSSSRTITISEREVERGEAGEAMTRRQNSGDWSNIEESLLVSLRLRDRISRPDENDSRPKGRAHPNRRPVPNATHRRVPKFVGTGRISRNRSWSASFQCPHLAVQTKRLSAEGESAHQHLTCP